MPENCNVKTFLALIRFYGLLITAGVDKSKPVYLQIEGHFEQDVLVN